MPGQTKWCSIPWSCDDHLGKDVGMAKHWLLQILSNKGEERVLGGAIVPVTAKDLNYGIIMVLGNCFPPWGRDTEGAATPRLQAAQTPPPSQISGHSRFTGFPGGAGSKESVCNAEDLGSIPGLGRSPGEGNGYPLQYSGLENTIDGGTLWAAAHGVTESDMSEWLTPILAMGKYTFPEKS